MPKAFPKEFRDDVIAVARRAEASVAQVAKDFGISESCLHRWLALADIEDGKRPGATKEESEALRELKKRNRLLEQWGCPRVRGRTMCCGGRRRTWLGMCSQNDLPPHQ